MASRKFHASDGWFTHYQMWIEKGVEVMDIIEVYYEPYAYLIDGVQYYMKTTVYADGHSTQEEVTKE